MRQRRRRNIGFYISLAMVCIFAAALAAALAFSFREYREQIVSQQEEQLLTISKAVSNSISMYTDSYFADLNDISLYEDYQEAGERYLSLGNRKGLRRFLSDHMKTQNEDVINFMICGQTNEDGSLKILIEGGASKQYISENHFEGNAPGSRIDILRDEDNEYYLGLSIPTLDAGLRLYVVINIERMYQKVAAYIRVGSNGYVMIKDSTGRILMHPVKEQIGQDVISWRKSRYPDFDLSYLDALIAHQKAGMEGTEIYYSYWWADEQPRRVRKIAAYTPLRFGNDFLIVSAVMDYNELATPISKAMITVAILSIALVGLFAALIYRLRVDSQIQRKTEEENEYLRKVNTKLEELRARQEQMAHNQRLQLMGTLTSGIAHEFNNLLTPIMGYSGLILADAAPGEDIYDSASEIYSAAEKAKEIIRQIASLSRKGQGKPSRPLNIGKASERILKMIDTVIPPDIHLVTEFDWDPQCCVLCSETEINQIILNLCTNAFYAMRGRDGVLKLGGRTVSGEEAKEQFHALAYQESYASFWVEDNGEGISEEQLNHIFDPFFTTKQPGEGTGLGLSTVQSILESLGGGIVATSELGKGSRFTCFFPTALAEAEEVELPKPVPVREENHPKTILLVEDDTKILKLFSRALSDAGFAVRAISDPLEAEKILRAEPIDVIVTDYAMPKMSGAQIASLARRLGLTCRVILVTGLVEEQVLEYYRKNLIQALLLKPLECSALVEAVQREAGKSPLDK